MLDVQGNGGGRLQDGTGVLTKVKHIFGHMSILKPLSTRTRQRPSFMQQKLFFCGKFGFVYLVHLKARPMERSNRENRTHHWTATSLLISSNPQHYIFSYPSDPASS